jgi:hypothetical protein
MYEIGSLKRHDGGQRNQAMKSALHGCNSASPTATTTSSGEPKTNVAKSIQYFLRLFLHIKFLPGIEKGAAPIIIKDGSRNRSWKESCCCRCC